MIPKIKRGLYTILIATALCGCMKDPESPNKIKTYYAPYDITHVVQFDHGGIEKQDNDQDFDGDGINDFYLEAKDGTIFSTHSSEYPPKTLKEAFSPNFYKHKKEK